MVEEPTPPQGTPQSSGALKNSYRKKRMGIHIEVETAPEENLEVGLLRRHSRAGSLMSPLPSGPLTPKRSSRADLSISDQNSPASSRHNLSVDHLSTPGGASLSIPKSPASSRPGTPMIAKPRATEVLGALHLAARQGNLIVLKMLLRKQTHKNVDVRDEEGWTPMLEAAFCKEDSAADMVQFLLDNGADITASNSEGNSITHLAAFNSHQGATILKQLLTNDNLTFPPSRDGKQTALHIAAHVCNIPALQTLIDSKKIDIDVTNDQDYTALALAANAGLAGAVEVLLENGANVSLVDVNGAVALHHAALSNSSDVCERLIKKEALVDKRDFDGSSPLQYAASAGNVDVVRCLLKHGADPNLRDENGHTSLHHAISSQQSETVQALLDGGAYKIIRGLDGRTPYDFACEVDADEATRKLLLIEYTPLLAAVQSENVEEVRRLLAEDRSQATVGDETGWIPLFSAVVLGRTDIVAMLTAQKENGIHNVDNAGVSALHYASANGHVSVISHLIDMGISTNKTTYQKRTPAHFAAKHESLEACVRLAEANPAAWTQKDAYGRTPTDYLEIWDDSAAVEQVQRVIKKAAEARVPIDGQALLALHTAIQSRDFTVLQKALKKGTLEEAHAQKLLIHATTAGWLEGAKLILARGTDPNCKTDTDQDTPLHIACKAGDAALVRELIERGARHGVINKEGDTPLNVISYEDNDKALEVVSVLLKAGADAERKDRDNLYPLHRAAAAGARESIALLVKYGADPRSSSTFEGRTVLPFDLAMENGHAETARAIVPESKLISSVIVGDTESIQQLLDAGASVTACNSEGNTALHLAVTSGNVPVLKLLLRSANTFNVNVANAKGLTPLHAACQLAAPTVVEPLLAADGINVNFHGGEATGITPMHTLPFKKSGDKDAMQILEMLTKAGADTSAVDAEFVTPLHLAASAGDSAAVNVLLQMGADPNAEQTAGRTPCDLASARGHQHIVNILRDITTKPAARVGDHKDKGSLELFAQLEAAGALSSEEGEDNALSPRKAAARVALAEAQDEDATSTTSPSYNSGNGGAPKPLPGSVAASPALVSRAYALSGASDFEGLGSPPDYPALGLPMYKKETSPLIGATKKPPVPRPGHTPSPAKPSPSKPALPAEKVPNNQSGAKVTIPIPQPLEKPSLPSSKNLAAPGSANRVRSAPGNRKQPEMSSVRRKLIDDLESANPAPKSPSPAIRRQQWEKKPVAGETLMHAAIRRHAPISEIKGLLRERHSFAMAADSAGVTPLHAAVQMNNVDAVRLLLANSANVDAVDKTGRTPLLNVDYESANTELLSDMISTLVTAGANINRRDNEGMNLIQIANQNQREDIVNTLIKHGATNINDAATKQLWKALQDRDEGGVLSALVDGANSRDVDKRNRFKTVLHEAARWCSGQVISQLLAKGALIDARDGSGYTPLHYAVQGLNSSAAKVLLATEGCDPNAPDADRTPPLHHVNFRGKIKDVRETLLALLESGATVDGNNHDGRTSLHLAAMSSSLGAAKLLLQYGASANRVDHEGKLPHDYVNEAANPILYRELDPKRKRNQPRPKPTDPRVAPKASPGIQIETSLNLVPTLKDAIHHDDPSEVRAALIGLDVNKKSGSQGSTALHEAVLSHKAAACRTLIDLGADLNATDRHGITPLHVACAAGHWDMAALLLINGADIEAQDMNGSTPLHVACTQGHTKIVDLLLSKGANVDAHDNDGRTPVYLCSTMGDVQGVSSLLQYGADVMLASRYGTPLESSQSKKHSAVMKMLAHHTESLAQKPSVTTLKDMVSKLRKAIHGGNTRVVEALLGGWHGELSTVTEPLVFEASKTGHHEIVALLLEAGANASLPGPRKQTPLHVANKYGHEECIALLMDHGADPTAVDENGETPFDLALHRSGTLGANTGSGHKQVMPPPPRRPPPRNAGGTSGVRSEKRKPPPPPGKGAPIGRSRSGLIGDHDVSAPRNKTLSLIKKSPSMESIDDLALGRGHAGRKVNPRTRHVHAPRRKRSTTQEGPGPASSTAKVNGTDDGHKPVPRPPVPRPRPPLVRRNTFRGKAKPPESDPLGQVIYQNPHHAK